MKPSWEMVERRAGCRMGTRVGTRAYLWFVLFAALFYLRRYFLPWRAVPKCQVAERPELP